MAIIVYVPRLETAEVKTALEIAEEEYRRAADESAKWNKFCNVISDTCGEYNTELEAVNKEFRNLAGRYKRSTKNDTRSRLYYQMLILRRQIESIESAVDWLQRMYDKAAAQYRHEYKNELATKRNVVNARTAAGLKYSVCVNVKCGDKQIPLRADVKTLADAVAFVYQNAGRLVSWFIYTERVEGLTTRRNTIAKGSELDNEIFAALIERYSDSTVVINAEIAPPRKATATHFDTPAGEFKAIVFRAMHYFTLDDFLTPIAELRAFCKRNKLPYAERELAEWIQMATAAGIEVPADTQVDTLESVNVEEYAVTPEAQSAAVEAEIENTTTAATETSACETADLHCDWLVKTICYYGGLKTRKIDVVRTITVASVGEAYEFITMKSDKHLAPFAIGNHNYRCQKCEYHQYSDMTLNVREYKYSNCRRPIVFEIDDFNGGTGTFAEFYIDGEITVVRVDASAATVENTTFTIGETYTGYDEYYGRREFKVVSRDGDYISFEIAGDPVQSYQSNRTASTFYGTAKIVYLEEYGEFEAAQAAFWDACYVVANFTITAIDITKPAAAPAETVDNTKAATTATEAFTVDTVQPAGFTYYISRWENPYCIARRASTEPIVFDRWNFP